MLRFFSGFLLGGTLGLAGGLLIMLAIFPFLFPPPMVNETVAAIAQDAEEVVATRFRENVPGQDAAHWGRGGLKVYRAPGGGYLLEFGADFEVGPGPNFWVYLNRVRDVDDEAGFKADAARVRLTKVKSFQGSQVYAVTAEQFAGAEAVTIWCESFHQYIASANLG